MTRPIQDSQASTRARGDYPRLYVRCQAATDPPAAVSGTGLVQHAIADGYQIFWLTGRPIAQQAGTVTNLVNAGYPTPAGGHLFLKANTVPWLSSCAPTCTPTQYKSLTRQHIESMGYDVVGTFGDQFSDLNGGFVDQTFRVPNPMHFLP
jgi:predicted secreted acid phosphatase